MPLSERLRGFLDSHGAGYSLTHHPQAFTAREVAAAEHLPPREVAKTVVVFGDRDYHMLVIPASKLVDFPEVRLALGLAQVRLATEDELARLFPDSEVGAMAPFGTLYGLSVFLDASLAAEDTIAFNAGTHREMVHMRTADFRRVVNPTVAAMVREPVASHGW